MPRGCPTVPAAPFLAAWERAAQEAGGPGRLAAHVAQERGVVEESVHRFVTRARSRGRVAANTAEAVLEVIGGSRPPSPTRARCSSCNAYLSAHSVSGGYEECSPCRSRSAA